jgi:ATP-dependent Clp protease protease subunit
MKMQPRRNNDDLLDQIHNYDVDIKNRVIYLISQDHNSEDNWSENGIEFKMATRFKKNIDYLNSIGEKPIRVILCSIGGCWNFGMMLFDSIKESKAPVDIYSYAFACSMASIVMQAARKRYISKHCGFMIHEGDYTDSGNMKKVKSGLDFYSKNSKIMFDIYAERCINGEFFKDMNGCKENVAMYLEDEVKGREDFWLNAEDAVKYGFADEVIS